MLAKSLISLFYKVGKATSILEMSSSEKRNRLPEITQLTDTAPLRLFPSCGYYGAVTEQSILANQSYLTWV